MKKTNQRATMMFADNCGIAVNGKLTERQKAVAKEKSFRKHGRELPYTITYYYELL